VNGLTDEVIKIKREGANYPENFCDDISPFRDFCSDTRHFVGHNIFYDKQYVNFWLPKMFCTMRANMKILGLKRERANGRPKFPSLGETAQYYGIEID
jgi:DNA polymerase-3 subunit epsilon